MLVIVGIAAEDVAEARCAAGTGQMAIAVGGDAAFVVIATVPRQEEIETFQVELDELAVENARIRRETDGLRAQVDGVHVYDEGGRDDVTFFAENGEFAVAFVILVADLVVVDEVDEEHAERAEQEEADGQEAEQSPDEVFEGETALGFL